MFFLLVAKNLQKDSLLDEGMKMIESIFSGNSFINLNKDINGLPIMVKVDGNRQVTAYVYDNRFVELIIEDLNRKIK